MSPSADLDLALLGLTPAEVSAAVWWVADEERLPGHRAVSASSGNLVVAGELRVGSSLCRHSRGWAAMSTRGSPPTGLGSSLGTVDNLFAVTVELLDGSIEGVAGKRHADPGNAEFFEGRQACEVSVNAEVVAAWGAAVGTHKVHVHGQVASCCLQSVPQIVEHRPQIDTGLKRRGTRGGCQLRRGRERDPSLTLRGDPLAGSSGVPADPDRRMGLL